MAGENNQIKHELTLFAEPVFKVGGFTVTNSLLSSFFTVILLVLFFWVAGRKIKKIPRGIQNIFETLLEIALNFTDSITNDRKKSEKILPISLALFLFILVNNWLGIFPFFGSIGFIEQRNGGQFFIPFLRGGTADINTTLALALFSLIVVHAMGIFAVGGWNYLNRFINLKTFLDIPKHFKEDKNVILVNPIKSFVGIVEIIGEAAKVASLSLRLFGNIFAGEVLIVSMMAIFAFLVPIPFMFLEILVGMIQAMVFSILVLVFMSMSTSEQEH